MDNKILVINPGSASKKYSFYKENKEALSAHFEKENGGYVVEWKTPDGITKNDIAEEEFVSSATLVINKIKEISEINLIGFRTVAPGEYFLKTRKIDDEFLKELSSAEERAPLHVSALHIELNEVHKTVPGVPKVSVSDSAFYKDRPDFSKFYGIPYSTAKEFEIFRFGYHGISAASVFNRSLSILKEAPSRMIVCHLGSGVSIIGIKDGKGVETSMGFTPLEGAMMSTRAGDIDPGALIYLSKEKNLSPDDLNKILNKESGLLGLSEISDDMRVLIEKSKEGNTDAKRAICVFVYQIKKQIGATIAAMGGIDALIFTATMGERSNIIREKICCGMEDLGIVLCGEKNNTTIGVDGIISESASRVVVAVIKTDEMKEIYDEIKDF